MTAEPLRLRELLGRLSEAEIRFDLIGGLAVNAWGYLRATQDIDVVPDPSTENLEKLDTLLRALGGRVDVGGRLLGSSAISTFLRTGDRTLDHLLAMKRASERPRDRDDMESLEAAQQSQAEKG